MIELSAMGEMLEAESAKPDIQPEFDPEVLEKYDRKFGDDKIDADETDMKPVTFEKVDEPLSPVEFEEKFNKLFDTGDFFEKTANFQAETQQGFPGEQEINTDIPQEREPNSQYELDGDMYETDANGNIYKKNGELLPNNEYTLNGNTYRTDENGEICNKQEVADEAAKRYNEKYQPYQRALDKGIENVKETPNGGVSFAETDCVYTKEDGTKCVVKIEVTGNRTKDFDKANEAMGLPETPEGYVWHHVDDYNAEDNTCTMELIKDEAHNATKPHAGGCAQYDAANGASYNQPRKEM